MASEKSTTNWALAFNTVYHAIETLNQRTYNYSTFSKEIMNGAVNRNTISNWKQGKTLPGHREDVIKLGTAAKYTESELNNLLLAAGQCRLYVRESEKVIYLLPSTSTNEEFPVPYYAYYEDQELLLQACLNFYENLYIQFHDKYNLVKGVPKTIYSDDKNTNLSIDALTGKWKETLNRMIYTAFNLHIGRHIKAMHLPKRKEIIIFALILCYTREDIDDTLEEMHFQALSAADDTAESVLICVLEKYSKRKVLKDAVSSAQYSLQIYAKVKETLKKRKINPAEYEWITGMYPESSLIEFVAKYKKDV